MQAKEFFQKMFSEEGTVSFSRFISALIVCFVLGWDTSFTVHTHQLPPAAELLGQAAFMTVFYISNRTTGKLTGSAPSVPDVPGQEKKDG
jgi:hypothetical protein